MNNLLKNFNNIAFSDKLKVLGGVTASFTYIISTDTVQKFHIKYRLLNLKFSRPPHMDKESYIARDNDIFWLAMKIPKRLSDTFDRIYLVGNPRGYGKSALVAEMAYKRDLICGQNDLPSGPVLFTDFGGVENANDAKSRILATIQPLFLPSFYQLFDGRDQLPHKLKLVKEVCLEMSIEKGENKKVVMWVLDSFSTLVSKALVSTEEKKAEYDGVISRLFNLNSSIIPVAVCSSATTVGALNEINPHIWVRSIPCHPPVVDDKAVLKKFVKSLCSKSRVVLSDEVVDDLISNFGGCLLLYEHTLTSENIPKDLQVIKKKHTNELKYVLNLQDGQVFDILSLKRYELLQSIARGEKIMETNTPSAEYLLAKHGKIQAFLGIHPEGHLVLALPMTIQSLEEIEPLVNKHKNKLK